MNVKKDNYYLGNVFSMVNGDEFIELEIQDMSDDEVDEIERLMAAKVY